MKLEYSQEAANRFGYAIAKLANGSEVKYTNLISDEHDNQEMQSFYKWKDKVTNYQGKDNDIISNDYRNLIKNQNLNSHNFLPTFPLQQDISLILANVGNLRNNYFPDKKLNEQSKKPLK